MYNRYHSAASDIRIAIEIISLFHMFVQKVQQSDHLMMND